MPAPFLLLWHPRVEHNADQAEIYLDLQPISIETFQAEDAATVYFDIQPGYIYVQIDYVLEIVGATRRWVIGTVERRWQTFEAVLRWAILKTRRSMWRF
jgi:hypothetical protein